MRHFFFFQNEKSHALNYANSCNSICSSLVSIICPTFYLPSLASSNLTSSHPNPEDMLPPPMPALRPPQPHLGPLPEGCWHAPTLPQSQLERWQSIPTLLPLGSPPWPSVSGLGLQCLVSHLSASPQNLTLH